MKKTVLLLLTAALLLGGCGTEKQLSTEPETSAQLPADRETAEPDTKETEPALPAIRVAVIDTGFSPESIPAENTAAGKNYLDASLSTMDTYGHGTAVAGIILDSAPDAVLVPMVSNAYDGGSITQVDNSTFAQMIRDAVDVYMCRIINISAGLVLDKAAVREAVEYAEEKGVLVVASVGNDYDVNGTAAYYPAAYETVLAVGALNADGSGIAAFSQRGPWVDLYAIGQEVTIRTLSGSTRTSDGSSYAAAKVTAAAANLLRQKPELTVEQLKNCLLESTDVLEENIRILIE